MTTPIGNILRSAMRPPGKYNVISFPTHERHNSGWATTNANFHLVQGTPGVKGNGWIESYAKMPNNFQLLQSNENPLVHLPRHIDFDFTLGQHKFGQAQTALQLSNYLKIPSIVLEHTTVTNSQLQAAVPQLREIRGDVNVFISEISALAWGWDLNDPSIEIIHHGVDSEKLFRPLPQVKKEGYILSIVNDWVNRGDILGWDIFQRVIGENKVPCRILGDNPGISKPAKNVYELVQEYNHASVFYNTSRFSPIPSVILEAMACGLPVVSTDNFLISEIIVNGVNGYKTNSEAEQLKHLKRLLNDPEERAALGKAARETIVRDFPMKTFVDKWNKVFDKVTNK